MRIILAGIALVLTLTGCAKPPAVQDAAATAPSPIERGRYLVRITGCNDCHTAHYAMKNGDVPEEDWLAGDNIGWEGPWGTTYARNLRMYFQTITEDQWVQTAHTAEFRPPMPWFNLRTMKDEDLRAMYQFVRSLGPKGEQVSAYLPPGTDAPLPKFKLILPGPPGGAPAAGEAPVDPGH